MTTTARICLCTFPLVLLIHDVYYDSLYGEVFLSQNLAPFLLIHCTSSFSLLLTYCHNITDIMIHNLSGSYIFEIQ